MRVRLAAASRLGNLMRARVNERGVELSSPVRGSDFPAGRRSSARRSDCGDCIPLANKGRADLPGKATAIGDAGA